jgi:hypothetical protein
MESQGDTDSVARRRRLPDDVAGAGGGEVITSAFMDTRLLFTSGGMFAIDGDSIDYRSIMRSWASNSTITPPTRENLNAGYPTRQSSRRANVSTPFSESTSSTSSRATADGRLSTQAPLPPVENLIMGDGIKSNGLPLSAHPRPFWDPPHEQPRGMFPPFPLPQRPPPHNSGQPSFASSVPPPYGLGPRMPPPAPRQPWSDPQVSGPSDQPAVNLAIDEVGDTATARNCHIMILTESALNRWNHF